MAQRKVLVIDTGHQAFDELDAADIPDLSADYDAAGAAAAAQAAAESYADGLVTGLFDFKGATNASGNPNYPVALKGDAYVISVAGKIGGASGISVEVGDVYVASADNAGGTQAAVGSSWFLLEHNLAGALLAANNLSDLANAGTARTNLGLGTAATAATGDFDAAGAAAAAQSAAATDATTKANAAQAAAIAASQPVDSDLTAFAGLAIAADTLPYGTGSHTLGLADFTAAGRALVDDADAAAQRTTLGLGTAATQASGAFDAAGAAAAAQAAAIAAAASDATTKADAAAAASIAKAFLDAKGDLISASANDTPAILSAGADDTILMADAAAATGLKWVASATPSTQAFGDAAAVGTSDTFTRGDHKHGMPASPTATVTWISTARWGL